MQINKLGPLRIWGLLLYLKWWGSRWQLADKASLALGARWHHSPKGRKGWGWTGKLLAEDLSFCGWVIQFQKSASKLKQIQSWKVAEGSPLPAREGGFKMFLLHQCFLFKEENRPKLFRNSMCIHLNASLPTLMCWGDKTSISGYNRELIKAALLQTFCGSFHSSLIKNKRREESFTAMSHLRYNGRNSKRLMRQNKADIMKAMSTH